MGAVCFIFCGRYRIVWFEGYFRFWADGRVSDCYGCGGLLSAAIFELDGGCDGVVAIIKEFAREGADEGGAVEVGLGTQ